MTYFNNIHLIQPLNFDDPTKDVVIDGKLTSDHDISFKVNNLIVFGEIKTKKNIFIQTEQDCFSSGGPTKLSGASVSIEAGDHIYFELNQEAVNRIKALGIEGINIIPQ